MLVYHLRREHRTSSHLGEVNRNTAGYHHQEEVGLEMSQVLMFEVGGMKSLMDI